MNITCKAVIAHRGWAYQKGGNTIAAFKQAIARGADMVEFDVHRLADGALVVFHDDEINGKRLKEMNAAEFHEQCLNLGIEAPTLFQTLKVCAGRIKIMVELKDQCGQEVMETILKSRFRREDYILISFTLGWLADIRRAYSGIRLGFLMEASQVGGELFDFGFDVADFWLPSLDLINAEILQYCAQHNIPLIPWTVNARKDMELLLSAEAVAGIVTDDPARALTLRRDQLRS